MNIKLLKKLKAFVSSVLILAVCFSNLAFFEFANAIGNPELTIDNQSATYGDSVTVPINGDYFVIERDIQALQFRVNFDNTKLTYTGYTQAAGGGNLVVNNNGTYITVVWDNTSPLILSNETFISLNFTVASNSNTTTDLTFSNLVAANGSAGSVTVNTDDGTITISSVASTGDVIINEIFVNPAGDPTGTEWYELFNTTDADIDLSGWTLERTVTSDSITLSGTLPANGILVFEKTPGSPANNAGDFLYVKQGATTIFALSYGNVGGGGEPHGSAPDAGEVVYVSDYSGSLAYSTSATSTMGWFNNAIDWTCVQLAGTGSPALPPTLPSITSCLADENAVLTNMGGLGNPSLATGLYFNKVLDTGASATAAANIIGGISFEGPLNLTDQNTVDYLKVIGNKLDIAGGGTAYAKVGLNTYVTGTTESVFKTKPATITMGQLSGLSSEPELIVKDNAGTVIDSSDGAYPSLTNKVFSDADNTYIFDTDHFTTFETEDAIAPTGALEYSKDNKATWSDSIAVKSGDVVDIRATFDEDLLDSPVVKLTIDNGLMAATNLVKGPDAQHYYYDDLAIGAGDFTANAAFSIGTDANSNVITATPTSGAALIVDNTVPTNQDTVFSANDSKSSGQFVVVVSAGEIGGAIWFAPTGTTTFSAGDTMTTATGTATLISAPATAGTYKLFVVDVAGNVSAESTATLTVTLASATFGNTYNLAATTSAFDATIDGSGNIYTAYELGGNVYVKKNRADPELIAPGSGPALAIDTADNVHIIYRGNTGLEYRKKTGSNWGTIRTVAGITTVFHSIDTDSAGLAHIAYDDGGEGGRGHIVYLADVDGTSWSASVIEMTGWYDSGSGNYYHQPVIRIDNNDKYHLAYEADNWGGRVSWSSTNLNIASNSTHGSMSVGASAFQSISLDKNSLALNGDDAYITYTDNGTQRVALVNDSWTVVNSFTGSVGTIYYKSGTVGVAYVNSNAYYIENAGSGYTPATDLGANSSPIVLLGSRHVILQDGSNIKLVSSETIQNTATPTVTGVTDDGVYNTSVTITFDSDATATLNGEVFTSGTAVSETGTYVLIVTNQAGGPNTTRVDFSIDTTGPTFTINDGVSGSPVKTDVFHIVVADTNGVDASTIEYGFSADNTCDNTDTYGNAFTSGAGFSIAGNHTDYLCIKATDNGGNTTYQLVGQLNTDNTAPTNQDTVFAASAVKKGGASVTVVSAGETGGAIWFAPTGTTTFSAGTTMTTAGGTSTTILAPATAGTYKLFIVDQAGNASAESTATLTVDNTAPSAPTITSIAANNVINNIEKAAIVIPGTAEAGSTVNITLTDSSNPANTATGSGVADGDGAFTITIDGTSLVDGAITVSATATDVAGNISSATTTPASTKDTGPLSITTNQTQDFDEDGRIDALKVTFNKNVLDSTVTAANFNVANYVGEAFASTTNGDVANNNIIYITFNEMGDHTSGDTPSLTYTQGTLTDAAGNLFATSVTNSTDKANPFAEKIGNDSADVTIAAGVDTTLTFSELLSNAGKTAVENALLAGADQVITFSWVVPDSFDLEHSILTISGHATELTTFDNDVMANTTDLAGNSKVLLLIDSSTTATQEQDNGGVLTLTNTTPEGVIVNPELAITATIAAGTTNPEINVDAFINNGTGVLPEINIISNNANNVNVQIPASTTVTSADNTWNGIIAAPTSTTVSIPGSTTNTAIQIGFTGAKLSFDNAVRILIPGQAGKKAGYVRTGIAFTEITTVCSADTQAAGNALPADGDCKIDVGGDLVIWTKHFTTFATYTTSSSSGGGGGGGSGSSSNPFTGLGISISINNGDQRTLTNQVTITLNGASKATKMAISNKETLAGAIQETFATTKTWTLPEGEGMKTVCVRFYDQNGYYSDIICDSIAYGANIVIPNTYSRQDLIRKIIILIIQKRLALIRGI